VRDAIVPLRRIFEGRTQVYLGCERKKNVCVRDQIDNSEKKYPVAGKCLVTEGGRFSTMSFDARGSSPHCIGKGLMGLTFLGLDLRRRIARLY
jgi:hypothetical protein